MVSGVDSHLAGAQTPQRNSYLLSHGATGGNPSRFSHPGAAATALSHNRLSNPMHHHKNNNNLSPHSSKIHDIQIAAHDLGGEASFELDLEGKIDELILKYAMITHLVEELQVLGEGDYKVGNMDQPRIHRQVCKVKDSLPTLLDEQSVTEPNEDKEVLPKPRMMHQQSAAIVRVHSLVQPYSLESRIKQQEWCNERIEIGFKDAHLLLE